MNMGMLYRKVSDMRNETEKQKQDIIWKVFDRTLTVRNVPYSILDAEDEKFISAGTSLKLELLKELMLQEEIPSEVDFREVANLKFSNG